MKSSFACMNSIGGFLCVVTVATLSLSHPIGAIAKTASNFSDMAMLIPLQLDGALRDTSVKRLVKGCTNVLYFCTEAEVLVSSSEPPPPPVPERSGGSR